MTEQHDVSQKVRECGAQLERDGFLRSLLRHLSGTLEEIVGLEEAEGFISVVGQDMGDEIAQMYRTSLDVSSFSGELLAEVLLDLKRRIQGDFYLVSHDAEKLVFGNRACPFGDKVVGRPSLCMMTSNVFGGISAQDRGYAKVELQQTIARGDAGCRVVVYLSHTDEARAADGREYFSSSADAVQELPS